MIARSSFAKFYSNVVFRSFMQSNYSKERSYI